MCRLLPSQSGEQQDVAVKTCKVVENEDSRKLDSRAEKFLQEACECSSCPHGSKYS